MKIKLESPPYEARSCNRKPSEKELLVRRIKHLKAENIRLEMERKKLWDYLYLNYG